MDNLLKKAKKAQKEKQALVAAYEAAMNAKRKAEYEERASRIKAYEAVVEQVKQRFNGYKLRMSKPFQDRDGWTVISWPREVKVSEHYNYSEPTGMYLLGEYNRDIYVAFNKPENALLFTLELRVCPREQLLQYEDIKPGYVWKHTVPNIEKTFTFTTAEALLKHLETLVVENMVLEERVIEAPKAPPQEPPKTEAKADVEVKINNPKVSLSIVKGGKK